jgi:hypothetical protein
MDGGETLEHNGSLEKINTLDTLLKKGNRYPKERERERERENNEGVEVTFFGANDYKRFR